MTTDLEDRLRTDLPRLADRLLARAAAEPAATVVPLTRARPRRRAWLVAAACLALLAGAVTVTVAVRDGGGTTTIATAPTTSPAPEPLDTWDELPPSPLSAREGASSVWTGREWLILAGRQGILALGDAAAYDPATERWRELAPNPTPHPGAQAVWTGSLVVELAKNGGWTYDPATDRYADLPLQPDGTEVSGGAAVWTGNEVVVIGFDREVRPAARTLDLATGIWGDTTFTTTALPTQPVAVAGAVWDGTRAVAVMTDGSTFAYLPDSGAGRPLPMLEVPGRDPETTTSVAGIGDRTYAMVATGPGAGGSTLQLEVFADGRWAAVGDAHRSVQADVAGRLVAAGDHLVWLSPVTAPVRIDPTTGEVTPIAGGPAGASEPSVAWTGDQLLVFGGRDSNGKLVDTAVTLHR